MQVAEKVFIDLIQKHQNIIHKICNVYENDVSNKADLYQEIILQAWKSYHSFKGNAQFSTWLYRVALNTAITFFKQNKKQSFIIHSETIPDIKEDVSATLQLDKIDKALVMLYLDNYSYDEIGEIIGITANYVAVKMIRIKAKLKESAIKYYNHSS
jgi:RNA polymerase sigma-70 factor, ECF subfamily